LDERDEPVALQRQVEVGEHCTLHRRRQLSRAVASSVIEHQGATWSEGNAEQLRCPVGDERTGRDDDERRIGEPNLARVVKAQRDFGAVSQRSERLRQAFEQRSIRSQQQDRRRGSRHGGRSLSSRATRRQSLRLVYADRSDLDCLGARSLTAHAASTPRNALRTTGSRIHARMRYATSGVMSTIPRGGMIRRSGASNQSVSECDQRTQREYGEIGSQEEITRTSNA